MFSIKIFAIMALIIAQPYPTSLLTQRHARSATSWVDQVFYTAKCRRKIA